MMMRRPRDETPDATAPTLDDYQRFIYESFDKHGLELHEVNDDGEIDCPQDDTCRCPRVAEANRLLHGWRP